MLPTSNLLGFNKTMCLYQVCYLSISVCLRKNKKEDTLFLLFYPMACCIVTYNKLFNAYLFDSCCDLTQYLESTPITSTSIEFPLISIVKGIERNILLINQRVMKICINLAVKSNAAIYCL